MTVLFVITHRHKEICRAVLKSVTCSFEQPNNEVDFIDYEKVGLAEEGLLL